MNFKNLSRAQFSKLINRINGVGEFHTILYVAKILYQSDNWFGNCLGGPKLYTDTHTPRHILEVLFFCENAETRLKTVLLLQYNYVISINTNVKIV